MTGYARNDREVLNTRNARLAAVAALPIVILLAVIYWPSFQEMVKNWKMKESYYSHGWLIPLVSLFLLWRKRHEILAASNRPSLWGYPVILAGAVLLLAGTFLGFRVFGQLSFVLVLTGIFLLLAGGQRTLKMWFPITFLLFMIPIPGSLTASIGLHLKLFATKSAVWLAQAVALPIVQEGAYIHFGDDHLIVGAVCGGLRSLIALIAFGALMAYIAKTRNWAKWVIFIASGPIAIVANVLRIFALCVVGHFWGSDVAAGTFHDVSGIGIFVVAFAMLFALESWLRRVAPAQHEGKGTS